MGKRVLRELILSIYLIILSTLALNIHLFSTKHLEEPTESTGRILSMYGGMCSFENFIYLEKKAYGVKPAFTKTATHS